MNTVQERLERVLGRIREAELRYGRPAGSVQLLAVSKTRPPADLRAALAAGQTRFGESYLSEALAKMAALAGEPVEWHFIGPVQSNKTRGIAESFQWVHSVDRLKIAQRLDVQRPASLPPLNVCLQVNISGEPTKSGISPAGLAELARQVRSLPRLRLRGLMAIPAPGQGDEMARRRPFRDLRQALENLNAERPGLDTLSMGMSDDFELAIAEGATLVRVGTDIFGPRLKVP